MEQSHNFLAFDCGATSGRAVLGCFSGSSFSTREVYRFPNSICRVGKRYYWDIFQIYGHILECLRVLGREGVKLDSIGIDTWGVDFGCVASDDTLLSLPRAYRDPYTSGVPARFFREVMPREELYAATGIQIMDFNTIFQLYAQTRAGDAALGGASSILFIPDLLSWMLTGKKVCEYTDASTSGLMDQESRQFNQELLRRAGIRTDILLPVVQPGTIVGTLRPEIAMECGLGEVPVVAVAGHDTASAVAAVPAEDEHFAYLSSGTWSLMGIEVPAPVINDASAAANFTNEGGIEGTTRFLKNITGMWLLEQCRKVWSACGREYGYDLIVRMAESAKAFSGRINPDDPRFANPADMDREIKAALLESGQAVPANDAETSACIFHSLASRYKELLTMLQGFAPFEIRKLHIIGGGAANSLLNQWTADETGIPVLAGPTEATALGNLLLQARCAGLVRDRWGMRGVIRQSFNVQIFNPITR
ncbi:MAG: rhamnulokinase [Bacteroidales bacterium]|nr:rhamnulokinase [Bacteroidales bacterium]